MTRRELLALGAAVPLSGEPIDRTALVRRHNPVNRKIEAFSALSVGNGEFAFTADITGLQTFPASYETGIPLCTQSQWGWYVDTRRGSSRVVDRSKLRLEQFDTYGRNVGYPTSSSGQKDLFDWLRENPHRLHLGRIGLHTSATADQLTEAEQRLDLWTGVLTSRFRLNGVPYTVRTACHPDIDCIVVEIEGDDPAVVLEFPFASPGMTAADWTQPDAHRSTLKLNHIQRELGNTHYLVAVSGATLRHEHAHRFIASGRLMSIRFGDGVVPDPEEVFRASESRWRVFWNTGGAIELQGSADPRATELERRIVLSQYLTAIQCSGSRPPQETGLTCNSWFGKSHLEMHWWHAAHFPLWGRTPMLERSMEWYMLILPIAKETAKQQGYTGARWPKMVGPDGHDSPSAIGPLLIWQQPHVLSFAELCFRTRPRRSTLDRYRDIVFETAEFMTSFAVERRGRYTLGPPLIPAQENHPPKETWNPTFELVYWAYGLSIAQEWRRRLGLPIEPRWEMVRRNLAALPVKDGVYLAHENCPQTFTERNRDHPSMLAALGMLPGQGVDRETMRATLRRVMRDWKWDETWGWDFPMTAMTAARLNEPTLAVEALLMDAAKNRYLPNGHNYQRPNLPVYLPGNGGLLAATAMMASKWNGFPASWSVRWEGLRPLL